MRSIERRARLSRLRDLAAAVDTNSETLLDFSARFGRRKHPATDSHPSNFTPPGPAPGAGNGDDSTG